MVQGIVCRRASVGAALVALALCASPAAAVVLPVGGAGDPPYVRKEFHSLTPEEVEAFRRGIELMKSRPSSDPTSWRYQANIHGTGACFDSPPVDSAAPDALWNQCQHGHFFFLPWHRMYLYFFERILRAAVREAVGDPGYPFALPYWDYDRHPLLAEPFRAPADGSNPLYAPRSPWCNLGLPCVPPPFGSSAAALALVHFCNCPPDTSCAGCQPRLHPHLTFGGRYHPVPAFSSDGPGQLESQPHNVVHILVGGPTGWMARPSCAARDPIFFLHHGNIDRLWQIWLNLDRGRANPLGASNWKNQPFTFVDETGQQVVMTACQVLDTAAQLGYVYDGVPVGDVQRCEEPILTPVDVAPERQTLAASEPVELDLGAEPVAVEVPVSDESDALILETALSGSGRILLIVDGVTLVNPGGAYSVYVNLPPWEEPDPNGPHLAGNLALFGDTDHPHEHSVAFDIAEDVRHLSANGLWRQPLQVTFVRITPEGEDDPEVFLRVRQVSVAKQ